MSRPHEVDQLLQLEITRRHSTAPLATVKAVYRRGLTASGNHVAAVSRATQFLDDLSVRKTSSPDADLFPAPPVRTKLIESLELAERSCDTDIVNLLLASAILPPESPHRAFTLNRALRVATKHPDPLHRAGLTASLRALVADGNSSIARSLRARRQLRDRYGRWIEMGGGVRFKVRSPGAPGGGTWYHGRVEGVDVPNGRVDVRLEDGRLVKVPNDKLEQPKAILNLPGMPLVPNTDPADLDPNAPEVDRLRETDAPANRVAGNAPTEDELAGGANDAGQALLRAIPENSTEREAANQIEAAVKESLAAPNLSRHDIQERLGNAAAFAERRGEASTGPEADAWKAYAEDLRDVSAAAAPEDPNQEVGEPDAPNEGPPSESEFLEQYNLVEGLYNDAPEGELRDRLGLIGNVIANVGRGVHNGDLEPERAAALLGQVDRMVDWTLDDAGVQQQLNPEIRDSLRNVQVDVAGFRERLANAPAQGADEPPLEPEADAPQAENEDGPWPELVQELRNLQGLDALQSPPANFEHSADDLNDAIDNAVAGDEGPNENLAAHLEDIANNADITLEDNRDVGLPAAQADALFEVEAAARGLAERIRNGEFDGGPALAPEAPQEEDTDAIFDLTIPHARLNPELEAGDLERAAEDFGVEIIDSDNDPGDENNPSARWTAVSGTRGAIEAFYQEVATGQFPENELQPHPTTPEPGVIDPNDPWAGVPGGNAPAAPEPAQIVPDEGNDADQRVAEAQQAVANARAAAQTAALNARQALVDAGFQDMGRQPSRATELLQDANRDAARQEGADPIMAMHRGRQVPVSRADLDAYNAFLEAQIAQKTAEEDRLHAGPGGRRAPQAETERRAVERANFELQNHLRQIALDRATQPLGSDGPTWINDPVTGDRVRVDGRYGTLIGPDGRPVGSLPPQRINEPAAPDARQAGEDAGRDFGRALDENARERLGPADQPPPPQGEGVSDNTVGVDAVNAAADIVAEGPFEFAAEYADEIRALVAGDNPNRNWGDIGATLAGYANGFQLLADGDDDQERVAQFRQAENELRNAAEVLAGIHERQPNTAEIPAEPIGNDGQGDPVHPGDRIQLPDGSEARVSGPANDQGEVPVEVLNEDGEVDYDFEIPADELENARRLFDDPAADAAPAPENAPEAAPVPEIAPEAAPVPENAPAPEVDPNREDQFGNDIPDGVTFDRSRDLAGNPVQHYTLNRDGIGEYGIDVFTDNGQPVYLVRDDEGEPVGEFGNWIEVLDAIDPGGPDNPELDPQTDGEFERRQQQHVDERDRPLPLDWNLDRLEGGAYVYRGPENYTAMLDENGNIVLLRRDSSGAFAQVGDPMDDWGWVGRAIDQDRQNRPAEGREALATELQRLGFPARTVDAARHTPNAEEMRQIIQNSPQWRGVAEPPGIDNLRLRQLLTGAQDLDGATIPEGEAPEQANRRRIATELKALANISDETVAMINAAPNAAAIRDALRTDDGFMAYAGRMRDLAEVDVPQAHERAEMQRFRDINNSIDQAGDLPEDGPDNGGGEPPPDAPPAPDAPAAPDAPVEDGLAEWERELLEGPVDVVGVPNAFNRADADGILNTRMQAATDNLRVMGGEFGVEHFRDIRDVLVEARRSLTNGNDRALSQQLQTVLRSYDAMTNPNNNIDPAVANEARAQREALVRDLRRMGFTLPDPPAQAPAAEPGPATDDQQRGPTPPEAVEPSPEAAPEAPAAESPPPEEAGPYQQGVRRPPGAAPERRAFHDANGVVGDRYGRFLYRGLRVRALAGGGDYGVVELVNEAGNAVTIRLDDGRRVVRAARRVQVLANDNPNVNPAQAPAAPNAPAAPAAPALGTEELANEVSAILEMHRAGANRGFPLVNGVVDARSALEGLQSGDLSNPQEVQGALDRAISGYENALENDRPNIANDEYWNDVQQRLARARNLRDRVGAANAPVDIPAVLTDVAAFRAEVPRNQRGAGHREIWRAGFALQDAADALRSDNPQRAQVFLDKAAERFRRGNAEEQALRAEALRDRLQTPEQRRAAREQGQVPNDDRIQPADFLAPRYEADPAAVGRDFRAPNVADPRDEANAAPPAGRPDVPPHNATAVQRDYNGWGSRAGEIAQAARTRPDLSGMFSLRGQELTNAIKAAFGSDEFGVQFGASRYTLRLVGVTPGESLIEAQFHIMDGDTKVGKTTRQLKVDARGGLSVYNSLMSIDSDRKKKSGFASSFNRYMENWYIATGVKKVDVGAGMTAGGYVWAINGFGWKNPRGNDPTKILNAIRSAATTEQERAQISILQRRLRAGDIPTPMEMALVGWNPSKGEGDSWAGKRGMLNQTWSGTKKLTPKDTNARQAQNYELAKNARDRAARGENAVQLTPEFTQAFAAGNLPGFAKVGLGPNQLQDISAVLSSGQSLANLPYAQKERLFSWTNDRLRKGEANDADLLALRAGLYNEIRADFPEAADLGPGEQLRDVPFDDVANNRVPGFTVTAPEGGGINDTYKVTHDESGQVFYYKRERAGSADLERDVAEFMRNAGWRGYGRFGLTNLAPPNQQEIQAFLQTLPEGDYRSRIDAGYDAYKAELRLAPHAPHRAAYNFASVIERAQRRDPQGDDTQAAAKQLVSRLNSQGVVVQQRAGDVMDFEIRPKNAARIGDDLSRATYANFDDPLRFQILDSLIANGDRHENNFQVGKDRAGRWWIFPIDHGLASAYADLGNHRPSRWFQGRNRIQRALKRLVVTPRGRDKAKEDVLRIIGEYRTAIENGEYVNTNFVNNMVRGLDELEQNVDAYVGNL